MELPTSSDIHTAWRMERDRMIAKHKSDLSLQDDLVDALIEELRSTKDKNLRELKDIVSSKLYRDVILPMAEKSLNYDMREIHADHEKRVKLIKNKHAEALAQHESLYREKPKAAFVSETQSTMNSGALSNLPRSTDDWNDHVSPPEDVSTSLSGLQKSCRRISENSSAPQNPKNPFGLREPLSWTIQKEFICGERRLIMRVQSKKRKASTSEEARPKRLRVDTSVDQVRTPAPTPSDEPTHSPKRTVTFHQVYQNGNAKHKDTIVEWPTGSQRWYILKCVEHGLRFTRRPVQGAAKHLNGNGHGREDRNRDYAVRALGYLVTDCNEHLASLNNRVAEEAYARGYKPLFSRLKKQRNHARDSSNKHAGERGVASKLSLPHPTNLVPGPIQEIPSTAHKVTAKVRQEAGTQSTFQNAPDSWNGITHPKTFRIYYGRWKGDSFGNEQGDQIYPVMILGWGSQNGSGLKDSDLDTTGLLKRKSKPPKCYIYESHRIAGWAPGYEDGGPKVRLRRFPVMFFDESQTVGWLPAQDLMKFPLNKRNAPAEPDHPFNAARRWVAEREGFKTWEEREKARIDANPPSVSPITPAGSTNEASHANLADGIGPDDWVSETSANSTATEKMMQDLRENGGEKTDDEDYVASHPGSDIDESLECEIDDWNRSAPSTTKHDSTTNRPWAFHGLRSTENINGPKPSVGSICQVQGNGPAGSSTAGISSERQLTIQECSSAADSRDPYITHISALAQSPERSRPMTQDPDQSDKRKPSDHTQIRNDNLAQSIAETLDFRNDMIAHLGQVDENLSLKSTHDVVIEVPSTSPCTNLTGNRLIRDDNRTEGDVLIDNTSASDHTVSRDANPVVNVMVSHLHGGSHGAENSEPLDVEGQATCHTNETVHDNQDSTSGAMGNRECVLPKGDSIGDSISSSTQPLANVRNAASGTPGLPSADVDFELSFYTNGDVSWEKANEEDGCLQLFHSADKKRVSTRQGPIAISIDPVEIVSFSRERDTLMGSKESTVFVLRHKDGSSSRLVFDRSRGSKLGNGKLQTRSFIKWLRVVKPDIACF